MRRRAAPRCPAAVCLQTARGDLPPGGRVCDGCQQKFWGRTGTIKRLDPALARRPEVGEIERLVAETVTETGATSQKDMGKVMKGVMTKLSGQSVDGKLVNELVRRRLSG